MEDGDVTNLSVNLPELFELFDFFVLLVPIMEGAGDAVSCTTGGTAGDTVSSATGAAGEMPPTSAEGAGDVVAAKLPVYDAEPVELSCMEGAGDDVAAGVSADLPELLDCFGFFFLLVDGAGDVVVCPT